MWRLGSFMQKEPGSAFRENFDKCPVLFDHPERVLCPRPRFHFKMPVFDLKKVCIGSANLTAVGISMKGEEKRNLEAGILTDEPTTIVEQAMNKFDDVWIGKYCYKCKHKDFYHDPINNMYEEDNLS